MSTAGQELIYSDMAEDPDFRELIEFFVGSVSEKREVLLGARTSQEWSAIQTTAHQLKGAGGGYGFPGLTDRAAVLESACKNQDINKICETLDHLLEYLDRMAV